MEPNYTTAPLDEETMNLFKKQLDALLEKYNCEVGIISTIQILKRVESPQPSPYVETTDKTEENPDSSSEESS